MRLENKREGGRVELGKAPACLAPAMPGGSQHEGRHLLSSETADLCLAARGHPDPVQNRHGAKAWRRVVRRSLWTHPRKQGRRWEHKGSRRGVGTEGPKLYRVSERTLQAARADCRPICSKGRKGRFTQLAGTD